MWVLVEPLKTSPHLLVLERPVASGAVARLPIIYIRNETPHIMFINSTVLFWYMCKLAVKRNKI